MAAGELTDKILNEVKKACSDDDVTYKFLSEIIFSEADRTKYSRYMNEYLDTIRKYTAEWSGKSEI